MKPGLNVTALAGLALAAALAACSGAQVPTEAPAAPQPEHVAGALAAKGVMAPRLIGVWRVLGEGRVAEITSGGVRQYQEAGALCYPDPAGSSDDPAELEDIAYQGEFSGAAARIELFELAGGPASQALEKLAALPAACRAAAPRGPAATFAALCDIMGADYPYFDVRHIDWEQRCRTLAPRAAAAADDDALQAVLAAALDGIGDAHVKLYRGLGEQRRQVFSGARSATLTMLGDAFQAQTEVADLRNFQLGWRELVLEQMQARLEGGGHQALDGALRWGRLPGNVGYIGLQRMLGFSADGRLASEVALAGAALDQALAALASTDALIVDLSFNGGGSDLVSLQLAGRFADHARPALTKQWRRPQGRLAQAWTVTPLGAPRYLKPVYLLTSDLTGSAAETFTLMMRAFPHVIHAGQATMGAIPDIVEHPLPGDFAVTFASEIVLDPAGTSWEARGIVPTLPLRMFDPAAPDTLLSGHDAAVSALLERARQAH
jgi:carboxyl-terminal processing protease